MQEYFEFGLGGRVLYKNGLARELGQILADMGVGRAFVVTDKGIQSVGLLSPILESIAGSIELVGMIDDIPANSSVRVVEAATATLLAAEADVIIAVGGGSPIDSAKGMRLLATYGGRIADYEGYNVIPGRLLPMVAIPTTAGTGSEVTAIAVILDEDEGRKIALVSRYLYPDLAILDPELTLTLPPRLTAATGMDALAHAIETFVSTENNPFSDSLALAVIDMIATHLRDAVQTGSDLEARGRMLMASTMAGIAFSNSLLGVVHALAHAIGGKYQIHHGTLNALILPHAMLYNSVVAPERYVRIAWAMGVNAGGRSDGEVIIDGINAVRTLVADCGLPLRLRDLDIPESALPELAALSLVEPAIFNNPRVATEEELLELLRAIW